MTKKSEMRAGKLAESLLSLGDNDTKHCRFTYD